MLTFWIILTVVPLFALVTGLVGFRTRFGSAAERFFVSPKVAAILCTIGWFWTAFECDTIGIDVFDRFLKVFPGQLWLMAAFLSWLTCRWMPKNLPVRALCGIFMLMPAELFKTTRLLVPASGFAPIHLLVALAYLYAIVGMYGMFYPWNIERLIQRLCATRS